MFFNENNFLDLLGSENFIYVIHYVCTVLPLKPREALCICVQWYPF